MQSILVSLVTIFGWCCLHYESQVLAVTILDTPYLASIEADGEIVCAGTIIDDRFILTSKTCTNQLSLNKTAVTVRVGTGKLSYRGQVLAATDIFPDNQMKTDLSLVKVAIPFEYDPHIMWCNMNNLNMAEGSLGTVSVWSGKERRSPLLLLTVEVINHDTCVKLLDGIFSVEQSQACVLPKISYADSCKADLGAPFFHDEMLFGVVSFNPGCDNSSLPLVMTELGGTGPFVISTMCGIPNIIA